MGRNGMGRNGYGPKWSWAEMVMAAMTSDHSNELLLCKVNIVHDLVLH